MPDLNANIGFWCMLCFILFLTVGLRALAARMAWKPLIVTTGAKVEFEKEKSGHHHERVGSIFASVVWTLVDHNIV
jgi:hypothetical protein